MTRDEWNDRCTVIDPGLYVGEVGVRANGQWLHEVGIDSVVSILTREQQETWDVRAPVPHEFPHRTFDFHDGATITPAEMDDILSAFGQNTLAHCISGANRSTAIALCWLVSRGCHLAEAVRRYYATRGMALAKVYAAVPRLSREMANNVDAWLRSKGN